MIELHDDRTDSARTLIETVHGASASEYPLLFQEAFEGATLSLESDGELCCACGFLVRELVLPSRAGGTRLRVGLIGSVSTGADFRGRGLGTRLLVEAEARLQAAGCGAVFLWADDPRFYLKRGYAPVGTEVDVLVPAVLSPQLPAPTSVRSFRPEDAAAVHALYEAHPARAERTQAETTALIDCPRMDALVRTRGGEVVAYALRGRGRDLAEVVHEWGGETDDVLALLRAHLERRYESEDPGALILMAPPTATTLIAALDGLGCSRSTGILGLGKLLDREVAAAALEARFGALGTARVAVVEDDQGRAQTGLHVAGPSGECFLDDEAALALLVCPDSVRSSATDLLSKLGLPEAELPLQPFLWGLDSI